MTNSSKVLTKPHILDQYYILDVSDQLLQSSVIVYNSDVIIRSPFSDALCCAKSNHCQSSLRDLGIGIYCLPCHNIHHDDMCTLNELHKQVFAIIIPKLLVTNYIDQV